jgi:hypothetical protein
MSASDFFYLTSRLTDQLTNRPTDLFHKIKDAVAVVQHQDEGCDEEKEHDQVHDAIAFASGILYVIHDG